MVMNSKNKQRKMQLTVLAVIGGLILLGITALLIKEVFYSDGIKPIAGDDAKVKLDDDSNIYSSGDDARLPDDYPSFVPEPFVGSVLSESTRHAAGWTLHHGATYQLTGESAQDVISYYQEELAQRDFTIYEVSHGSLVMTLHTEAQAANSDFIRNITIEVSQSDEVSGLLIVKISTQEGPVQ